jgi:hypothetical protein
VPLCPFVKTGIMHNDFHRFLKSDGNGIDYSYLVNYDTAGTIDNQLSRQHPYWEGRLKEAMRRRDRNDLRESLNNAIRVRLNVKKPKLIEDAQNLLNTL